MVDENGLPPDVQVTMFAQHDPLLRMTRAIPYYERPGPRSRAWIEESRWRDRRYGNSLYPASDLSPDGKFKIETVPDDEASFRAASSSSWQSDEVKLKLKPGDHVRGIILHLREVKSETAERSQWPTRLAPRPPYPKMRSNRRANANWNAFVPAMW